MKEAWFKYIVQFVTKIASEGKAVACLGDTLSNQSKRVDRFDATLFS